MPDRTTSSYDVRRVAECLADDDGIVELWTRWAPQLVTALGRIAGRPVGFVANQPQALAGTLDISASQKGARFVRFCDAFNLPLITLVDTPGFLPGKDLEWRGMIRHGAELAFAYSEATVPRVCVILRKAYGGAYIVMDSKGLGNDLCFAWPGSEIAVMGAEGAVQILHRRAEPEEQAALRDEYAERYLTPWEAAERGFVDAVIDPAQTRQMVIDALRTLETSREHLPGRKHTGGRSDTASVTERVENSHTWSSATVPFPERDAHSPQSPRTSGRLGPTDQTSVFPWRRQRVLVNAPNAASELRNLLVVKELEDGPVTRWAVGDVVMVLGVSRDRNGSLAKRPARAVYLRQPDWPAIREPQAPIREPGTALWTSRSSYQRSQLGCTRHAGGLQCRRSDAVSLDLTVGGTDLGVQERNVGCSANSPLTSGRPPQRTGLPQQSPLGCPRPSSSCESVPNRQPGPAHCRQST